MPMPGICKATKKGSFDEDLAARRGEYSGQGPFCSNGPRRTTGQITNGNWSVFDHGRSPNKDCNEDKGWFTSIDDQTGHYCIRAEASRKGYRDFAEEFCQESHGGSLVSIHSSQKGLF